MAPSVGLVDTTVGSVVSGITVNDHVLGSAIELPATSAAPVVMVAV